MLTYDFRDFERAARSMGALADQIPFALAGALNAAAEEARKDLIGVTWATHVSVRDPNFLKNALTTRGNKATKRNLHVAIVDKLGRGSLALHASGGVKRPRGGALAVPSTALKGRRSGRGVPKGLRPRAIPNSFRRGDEIYQRVGKGKGRSLRLMYTLEPSVRIAPDVPFEADFASVMRREMPRQFAISMGRAMATAFRK